jgi:hypothetical protein
MRGVAPQPKSPIAVVAAHQQQPSGQGREKKSASSPEIGMPTLLRSVSVSLQIPGTCLVTASAWPCRDQNPSFLRSKKTSP